MHMMSKFNDYWGFQKTPFSLMPDPEMLYPSRQHRECLIRMRYAIQTNKGGILIVSNNPGDGKTSILNYLCQELREDSSRELFTAVIDHPSMTPNQMIREIALQLGVEDPSRDRHRNLNQLRSKLYEHHRENHLCLIIVDEAHMLNKFPQTLQELRMLLNFSMSSEFLLTIILSGQKPLEGMIRSIPEFWQRLPVRFFLGNLDRVDTEGLIRFRLKQAGYSGPDIFMPDGFDAVFQYSQGIPRIICSLADIALLIAFTSHTRHVDLVTVHDACMDLEGSSEGFHYFKMTQLETLAQGKPEAGMRK